MQRPTESDLTTHVRGTILDLAPCGHMNLPAARTSHNIIHVVRTDSPSGQYLDPLPGAFDEFRDQLHSFGRASFLSAGKNARHTYIDKLLKCLKWIWRHVERAMKHSFAVADIPPHPLTAALVDAAIF